MSESTSPPEPAGHQTARLGGSTEIMGAGLVRGEMLYLSQRLGAIESQLAAMQQPQASPAPASLSLADELAWVDWIVSDSRRIASYARNGDAAVVNELECSIYRTAVRIKSRLSQLPNAEQIARRAKIEALKWARKLFAGDELLTHDLQEVDNAISRLESESAAPAQEKVKGVSDALREEVARQGMKVYENPVGGMMAYCAGRDAPPPVKAKGLRGRAERFRYGVAATDGKTWAESMADFTKSELLRQLDELDAAYSAQGYEKGGMTRGEIAQARKALEAE